MACSKRFFFLDFFQRPRTDGPTVFGILFSLAIPALAIAYFASIYKTNQTTPDISSSSAIDTTVAASATTVPFQCMSPLGCAAIPLNYADGACQGLSPVFIPYGLTGNIPVCFLNGDAVNNLGTVILGTFPTPVVYTAALVLGQLVPPSGTGNSPNVTCGNNCAYGLSPLPICNVQLATYETQRYNDQTDTRYVMQNVFTCISNAMCCPNMTPCHIANVSNIPNYCSCSFSCSDNVGFRTVGTSLVMSPVLTSYTVTSGKRSNLALLGETGGVISLLVALISILVSILNFLSGHCCQSGEKSGHDSGTQNTAKEMELMDN